jgi:cytochrome c-type biogenesis protein CcmH/NrfG
MGTWRDPITFYSHIIQHAPQAWRPYVWLAETYQKEGRLSEALSTYEAAYRLTPRLELLARIVGIRKRLEASR